MRPHRRFIRLSCVLFVAGLLASACIFGGEDDPDLSAFFPEPEQEQAQATAEQAQAQPAAQTAVPQDASLLDVSVAPTTALGAVQKFYALIAAGRANDAYRFVSLETRERISEDDFVQRYADIWDEGTIEAVNWEIVPPPGANVAGIEVILRYTTALFGEFEDRVFAPTRRQPNWVVDWTPNLIFDGLSGEGFLVHRFIDIPVRGAILDRNGVPLATNGEVVIIGVSHDLIEDEDAVVEILVQRLQLDETAVRNRVFQDVPSYFFIPVAELPVNASPQLIADFEQLADVGILLRTEPRRVYPEGELAAQVIGFLSEINPEELEARAAEGYEGGDIVGRDGVEAIFERELSGGRGGRLTIVAPGGEVVRELAARSAQPGRDVVLTLDLRMQRVAEAALADQPGAIVAMDPRSNEILALASYPRFDPNAFIDGLTEEEFELYFENPLQPFINRAVEQTYAPGSIFKVITFAAALESGRKPDDRISCPAIWTGLGEETPLKNWKEEDQGEISLTQALAESCNTVFYELGIELDQQDQELLPRFAAGFGFGEPTGAIGLGEVAGVNPGPDWKRVNLNDFWYTGDTVNMSIGQGFVSVTPLQIANAYAAIASDGVLKTPVAVRELRSADGSSEQFLAQPLDVLPISAETLAIVRGALRDVVVLRIGTGWVPFNGTTLSVAGKSGTAEDLVTEDEEESVNHAWFAAYANSGDPKLVVAVVLDDGESGADDAGPIARTVLERSLLSGWIE